MKTVSMKLTPAEAKDYTGEAQEAKAPQYPYCLCLYLDKDTLAKLGITELPAIDTEFELAGRAVVMGTSERKMQGGEAYQSLDLQITDLGLQPAGGPSLAQKVYPAKQA